MFFFKQSQPHNLLRWHVLMWLPYRNAPIHLIYLTFYPILCHIYIIHLLDIGCSYKCFRQISSPNRLVKQIFNDELFFSVFLLLLITSFICFGIEETAADNAAPGSVFVCLLLGRVYESTWWMFNPA